MKDIRLLIRIRQPLNRICSALLHILFFIDTEDTENNRAMITDENYRFNLSITVEPYLKKPEKEQFNSINFRKCNLTVDELVTLIEQGYGYAYVFGKSNFHISYKRRDNFKYTKVLAFDIDDSDCDFETALNSCAYVPTIAYRTYSDGENGNCSYRFVYVFQDYINSLNFNKIYEAVSKCNGFKNLDKRDFSQFYFGTNKDGTFISYCIYSFEDFNVKREFYATHSPLIPSEDGTYYTFPDEYYEIRRLWAFDPASNRRYVRKYTDSGKLSRRKQLFIDGQIIKKINGIDSVSTMYRILCNEMRLYYDNTEDTITDNELMDIAERIIRYPFKCKPYTNHPQFRINVEYWKTVMYSSGINYNPIIAINHIRKQIQLKVFKEFYNKDLSFKENMKIMKDNGFKVSKMTYYRYLGDIRKSITQDIVNTTT